MSDVTRYIIKAYRNIQYNRWLAGAIEDDDFQNVAKLVKESLVELDALEAKAAALDAYRDKVQAMGEG